MPLYLVTTTKHVTLSMYVLADSESAAQAIAADSFDEEECQTAPPNVIFEHDAWQVSAGEAIRTEWIGCSPYGERKDTRFTLGETWEGGDP